MTVPFKGDPYRLKIHLTPPTGWMNDPNGFTQYKGAYHIFYQAYPYSADGGIKHWGHVVTNDFQQYTFLPPALYPQEFYDCQGCYSGSAIEKEHELCILYTGHVADRHPKEEQCLAKSRDGVHFEKHPGNPVIPHPACMEEDFRDPYMWKKGEYYYCIIGSKWNSRGRVLLYRSRDLLSWEFVNVMLEGRENQGDMWECPCLTEYPEGALLLISPENREGIKHSSWYFTGELDYETGRFLVEKEGRVDWGTEFYAPQMINSGGRKLLLAWMDNWESEKKSREYQWAGALTYPREVKIQRGELIMYPIEEIKKLYQSDVPIFAICLGHQLMALANGADTHKMKYGHRGGNHPVKDLETGRVYISSQNHGYVVDTDNLDPKVAVPAFINVNDGTNEGLKYTGKNIFTVQFHPEACPGPQDSGYLFDRFLQMMGGNQ